MCAFLISILSSNPDRQSAQSSIVKCSDVSSDFPAPGAPHATTVEFADRFVICCPVSIPSTRLVIYESSPDANRIIKEGTTRIPKF